jgi:hypothetical protein
VRLFRPAAMCETHRKAAAAGNAPGAHRGAMPNDANPALYGVPDAISAS